MMRAVLIAAVVAVAGGGAFAQTAPGAPSQGGTTVPGGQMPGAQISGAQISGAQISGGQIPGGTVNTTPQTASPSPSAVQTQNTTQRTAAAPVPGRNSFTRGEAAKRIGSAGYTHVGGLKKDSQGIWRGTAHKDGSPVGVALDYQGNVVSQ